MRDEGREEGRDVAGGTPPLHPSTLILPPVGRFSQQTLEQVAAANDVVEIVGGYVPLKRAGSAYKGLCPFHREKTPSFTVNPQRQSFHCFGCGKGGGVFRFLMDYENLDFPAAVRRLAERAGVPLLEEEVESEDDAAHGKLRRRLLGLHAEATEWFHLNLMRRESAAHAREYLKKRGFSAEVAASWKFGYAPAGFDSLREWARGRGYSDEELLAGGLVKFKDDSNRGRPYDRFRDRLMFPICNELGEPIAFSGRILASGPEAERAAKYLNSPETPLFTKGKVLFGLHKTRRAILDAKTAIVCEGQIDLITVFESGVQNVVAPQGTAFTDRQARLLKRYTEEAVLCFDADAAGQQAAERSFAELLLAGVSVRVAEMPPGEDPDSLVRKEGPDVFRAWIGTARDFFDFQIDRMSAQFDLDTPRGKAGLARRLADSVALVGDPLLRQAVVGKITARLGLRMEDFHALLRQVKPRRPSGERDTAPAPDLAGGEDAAPAATDLPAFEPPRNGAVDLLLTLALRDDEVHAWLLAQDRWQERLRVTPGAELLVRILEANGLHPSEPATVNAFLATLTPAEESYLSARRVARAPEHGLQVAEDCWLAMERDALTARRVGVLGRLAQPGLPEGEVVARQKEMVELQTRLAHIGQLLSSRRPSG